MPFEPFRFIHAANLSLDHQLRETGPLSDQMRETVEDATLTAFDRLVTTCVEERVDFLLLTGNSFVEEDRSLRARAALLRAFQRLREHGIVVFVLPGTDDPPEAWQAIGDLPDNVTLFLGRAGEPVAVRRDSRVIASVVGDLSCEASVGHQGTGDSSRFVRTQRTSFTIGLHNPASGTEFDDLCQHNSGDTTSADDGMGAHLSDSIKLPAHLVKSLVDYVALGGKGTRRAITLAAGIAHHPGGTQSLGPRDTGPHGCTLVDVDDQGTLQSKFLSTAAVRWEWFEAKIEPGTSHDSLSDMMRTALAECRPEPGEKVFLITWAIHGAGPLFESLYDDGVQKQLIAAVLERLWSGEDGRGGNEVRLQHTFRLFPQRDEASQQDALGHEYFELLEDEEGLSGEGLLRRLEEAAFLNADGHNRGPAQGWPQEGGGGLSSPIEQQPPRTDRESVSRGEGIDGRGDLPSDSEKAAGGARPAGVHPRLTGRLQAFASELDHAAILGYARQLGTKHLAASRKEESAS